jgi:hypothetical protein
MRVLFTLLIAGVGATTLAYAASDVPPSPPVAGEAVVVVGGVTASDGLGRHALQNGAKIAEGTTVNTEGGGYLYIVTVDKGFISIRPNSSVTIERYRYDAARPEKTEIKIVLNRGVVRAISGTGAQAARENYRMNTPVVALGIRGTDFSVFADSATTRAEVRRGGIVLTPFGADCLPSGSGPCEGPRAAQLFTGDRNVLLQFRRGDIKPVALDETFSHLRPDRIEPPRKSEAAPVETNATQPGGGVLPITVAPGELTFAPPEAHTPPIVTPPTAPPSAPSAPSAPTPAPPPSQTMPEAPQVVWGRWSALAGVPATATPEQLMQQASELVAVNEWFAIFRVPRPDLALPVAGRFDFQLQAYEAFLVNPSGTAHVAQIQNPALSIDFGQRRFDTRFNVVANGTSYDMTSKGSVMADGKLQSELNPIGFNTAVQGTLGGKNGTQAGYIFFSQPIDSTGTKAVGATSWSR